MIVDSNNRETIGMETCPIIAVGLALTYLLHYNRRPADPPVKPGESDASQK
jgi:hypothetical protein